jgi:hypothetical protein
VTNPVADPVQIDALFRESVGALERGRADLARAPVEKLCSISPNHPKAELLRQCVAIMSFDWPVQRMPYMTTMGPAPDPASIDVVAFHADLPAAPSGIHEKVDYVAVLALSFESAAIRAPRARRVLLTDDATVIPAGLKVDEVMRFPMDHDRLMYERMRVQASYLGNRAAGRHSVLIDSDVVVNRDPAPIFAEAFDVGLTWRAGLPNAPFNGGAIFVASGEAAAGFFTRARSCYDAFADTPSVAAPYPRGLRGWWGDQFALALMVGYQAFAERKADVMRVDGVRVRFFPCDDYNYTIEAREYPPSFFASKFLVHFKGNRKVAQAAYLDLMRAGKI